MPECPKCDAATVEDQRYCSDCGTNLHPRPSSGRDAILALAAVASVGLATIGLEALLNRLLRSGRKGKR